VLPGRGSGINPPPRGLAKRVNHATSRAATAGGWPKKRAVQPVANPGACSGAGPRASPARGEASHAYPRVSSDPLGPSDLVHVLHADPRGTEWPPACRALLHVRGATPGGGRRRAKVVRVRAGQSLCQRARRSAGPAGPRGRPRRDDRFREDAFSTGWLPISELVARRGRGRRVWISPRGPWAVSRHRRPFHDARNATVTVACHQDGDAGLLIERQLRGGGGARTIARQPSRVRGDQLSRDPWRRPSTWKLADSSELE
jgi:hypothetical protein